MPATTLFAQVRRPTTERVERSSYRVPLTPPSRLNELRVVRIRHLDRHVAEVLDKFGIQGREREDFPGAAASLKGYIVQA